ASGWLPSPGVPGMMQCGLTLMNTVLASTPPTRKSVTILTDSIVLLEAPHFFSEGVTVLVIPSSYLAGAHLAFVAIIYLDLVRPWAGTRRYRPRSGIPDSKNRSHLKSTGLEWDPVAYDGTRKRDTWIGS